MGKPQAMKAITRRQLGTRPNIDRLTRFCDRGRQMAPAVADAFGSGAGGSGQVLEVALLNVLVEAPSLYLVENFRKLLARNRLVNEAFAAPEMAEVPWAGFKFWRHRVLHRGRYFGRSASSARYARSRAQR
jgi:hypothetical protein